MAKCERLSSRLGEVLIITALPDEVLFIARLGFCSLIVLPEDVLFRDSRLAPEWRSTNVLGLPGGLLVTLAVSSWPGLKRVLVEEASDMFEARLTNEPGREGRDRGKSRLVRYRIDMA